MLKRVLEEREKEVVNLMMMLYDKAQVLEAYIESVRREAAEAGMREGMRESKLEGFCEGAEEARKYAAAVMYGKKMPLEVIAEVTRQSVPTIRKWLNLPSEVAE